MQFKFDPRKNKENVARHGLSLELAEKLAWDEALVWLDERFEYDEIRMIALAPKGATLYYVAFVDRADIRRPISLRRAERKEVKYYVENFSG